MSDPKAMLVAILLTSAGATLCLAIITWRRREDIGRAASIYALCLALMTVYSVSHAMQWSSASLPTVFFSIKLAAIALHGLAPTLFLFALLATGHDGHVSVGRIIALYVVPSFCILALLSNEGTALVYRNPVYVAGAGVSTFRFEKGPLYWLGVGYLSLCLVSSVVLFVISAAKEPPPYRTQAVVFALATLIPWVGGALSISGHAPYHLDLGPLLLSVCTIIIGWAILERRVLEIIPLARDSIFEGLSDGALVLDRRDRIVDLNPIVPAMLPEMPREPIGLAAVQALAAYPELIELVHAEATSVEFQVVTNHAVAYYQSKLSYVRDRRGNINGRTISIHDYTHTHHLVDQLERLATVDDLTGVNNRRYFEQLVSRETSRCLRYGRRISIIWLDIDNFKRVNDTFGHSAGDVMIRTIAQMCQGMIRQCDILGRVGGEEFAVCMPETAPAEAAVLAERIRVAIAQLQVSYEGHSISTTASFGIFCPESSADATVEVLFRYADKALYQAKQKGRNQVCVFGPE